jgi:hypothetical protein
MSNIDVNNDPGTAMSTTSTAICHAVPCHISYTGPSSGIDIFFNPMEISSSSSSKLSTTATTSNDNQVKQSNASYQAATIRGRGLLAHSSNDGTRDAAAADVVCGHVFQVITDAAVAPNHHDSTHTNILSSIETTTTTTTTGTSSAPQTQKYLQSIRTFDTYVEWYHEHQTCMVPHPMNDVTTRFHRAMEWMNTADCLHTPLPLPTPVLESSLNERRGEIGSA